MICYISTTLRICASDGAICYAQFNSKVIVFIYHKASLPVVWFVLVVEKFLRIIIISYGCLGTGEGITGSIQFPWRVCINKDLNFCVSLYSILTHAAPAAAVVPCGTPRPAVTAVARRYRCCRVWNFPRNRVRVPEWSMDAVINLINLLFVVVIKIYSTYVTFLII